MTIIYEGARFTFGARVHKWEHDDQISSELVPRYDLRNHSPTGFEWGYQGSGPAQLALAILADAVGDELAQKHYQEFKREVIARIFNNIWTISLDYVSGWVEYTERINTGDETNPKGPTVYGGNS